eukprot:6186430-Pyramimonas_sp.AAC.1
MTRTIQIVSRVMVPASSPSSPTQYPCSSSFDPAAGSGALPTRAHACLHASRQAWKTSGSAFEALQEAPPRSPGKISRAS